MYFKRMLVGASMVGIAALPISWVGTGVAAAEPSSACPQPAPIDPAVQAAPCDEPPAPAGGADGFALSPGLSDQINQAVGNLPSPVELNAPVDVGFGLGLPGIALPGLSVPLVLGGISTPQLPEIGPPQLPALPAIGPPQVPGIGIPKLPF